MTGPAVSVILPCFNAEATIVQAVQSIQGQTFDQFELIVLDDGSTDGSRERVEALAAYDVRIRLIAAEHRGIVMALQHACRDAGGTFLARMDADDIAHPTRLARQLALMHDEPELALCGTHVEIEGESVGEGRLRYADWLNSLNTHACIVRDIFIECPLAHPTFMMRRTAYESVGGYRDAGWAEDYDLVMRLYTANARLGVVPEPLLKWREHENRLSMRDTRYSPESFRALKRHYLYQTYLDADRPFIQWGAGEVGKAWLREWGEHAPQSAVDINPRKIGRMIHGCPIISPDELPPPGQAFVLVAVGAPGARTEIRAWFAERGWAEGPHFVFVA